MFHPGRWGLCRCTSQDACAVEVSGRSLRNIVPCLCVCVNAGPWLGWLSEACQFVDESEMANFTLSRYLQQSVTCCNSWTTRIGNRNSDGVEWTSGGGGCNWYHVRLQKWNWLKYYCWVLGKGSRHAKHIWWLLKKERKECHFITVTAVVGNMSTFSSSLRGFSLCSPWVWQSLEASSLQPIKQHGDPAPYSPLVTYSNNMTWEFCVNLFFGFVVCNSSNCLASGKVIMSEGYWEEWSIGPDRFASLSNRFIVAWTIAFIAVNFLVSTQSFNLQTG